MNQPPQYHAIPLPLPHAATGLPSTHSAEPPPATQLSREQIIAATGQCLSAHGYDGTTIRRIASLLDCAVGSIYRYFTDKRELLAMVTELTLEPAVELAEQAAAFDAVVRRYCEIVQASPQTYRLMFWLSAETPEPHAGRRTQPAVVDPKRLPVVVQRLIEAWSTQLGSPDRAGRAWSLLHGLVTASIDTESVVRLTTSVAELTFADRQPAAEVIITAKELPVPQPRTAPNAVVDEQSDAEDLCLL